MKETFYFSHDYNARDDEKILQLRMDHGWEGYGLYWAIIEKMASNGGKLGISTMKGLAFDLRVEIDFIIKIIQDYNLFTMDSENDNFYNNRLLEHLNKRDKIKESRSAAGKRGGRMKSAKDKGTHTKGEWSDMKNYFGCCVKCSDKNDIEKDHIIPVYNEGSDDIGNLQPLCKRCNTSKGSDKTDYRILFCEANDKQMPSKWLAKCNKVKESKVKESKVIKYIDMETPAEISIVAEATTLENHIKEHFDNKFIGDIYDKYNIGKDDFQEQCQAFLLHWKEKSPNGRKQRWQKEKVFDPKLRFRTRMRNNKNWNSNKSGKKTVGITTI